MFVCLFVWSQAKEAELQLINRILDDSDLTADKFREWKQCNEELFLEIERLAVEKERAAREEAQAAELVTTATEATEHQGDGSGVETVGGDSITVDDGEGGAFGLRLSLGEELVDSEPPSAVTTAPDSSQTELSVDPLNLSSASASSESYFYI